MFTILYSVLYIANSTKSSTKSNVASPTNADRSKQRFGSSKRNSKQYYFLYWVWKRNFCCKWTPRNSNNMTKYAVWPTFLEAGSRLLPITFKTAHENAVHMNTHYNRKFFCPFWDHNANDKSNSIHQDSYGTSDHICHCYLRTHLYLKRWEKASFRWWNLRTKFAETIVVSAYSYN